MTQPLRWTPGYRIIRMIYPPVDLFEDIADPADWELLVAAEAKLNPGFATRSVISHSFRFRAE